MKPQQRGEWQHGLGRYAAVALTSLLAAGLSAPVSSADARGAPVSGIHASGSSGAERVPASATGSLPEAIGARRSVRQMVTVSAHRFASTTASLKAWRRDTHGQWVLARGPVTVAAGYSGWALAAQRRQSTGTTPAGRFSMPYAFGRLPDPGARLEYRRVDDDDWWPYEPRDPATYNVYQRHKAAETQWRRDKAEHLDTYRKQYGYAIVVGFNLPSGVHYSKMRRQWVAKHRADTRRGGGIFLHVSGDGPTAGCVSMPRVDARWLLRWLRPSANPQVVMGPHDYIVTL